MRGPPRQWDREKHREHQANRKEDTADAHGHHDASKGEIPISIPCRCFAEPWGDEVQERRAGEQEEKEHRHSLACNAGAKRGTGALLR